MDIYKALGKFEDSIYALEPEEGECEHHWVFKGCNKHGEYYRCSRCGQEEEI